MHREHVPDRVPGKRSPTESLSVQRLEPGKRTLTEALAVQRSGAAPGSGAEFAGSRTVAPAPATVFASGGPRPTLQMLFGVHRVATAGVDDPAQVHAAAAHGTATPATRLPYADQIQRAFGRHDVSGIQAHVGPDAAASARTMGAQAYATGDHIVLGDGADLHTVAHEAAHVVQQRAGVHLKGGVGQAGDAYELHADRVADLVVSGKSAEAELSSLTGGGGGGATPAIQQKLKLTGSKTNMTRALTVINKGLFGHMAKLAETGYVTLETKDGVSGKATPQQEAMYNYLNTIISDSNDIVVTVDSGSTTLVGKYRTSLVDIQDIEAMAGGTGASDLGTLIHELVEQYHKQIHGTDYEGAHGEGIKAENAVNGSVRGVENPISITQHDDGTVDAVVEIPYTYPNGKVVTTTWTVVKNKITKSEDKVTTLGRD